MRHPFQAGGRAIRTPARRVRGDRKPSRPRLSVEALEGRALLALTPLDPTFGQGGTALINIADTTTESAAFVQPDGKVLVVGLVSDADIGGSIFVKRYNVDGTPDATFGTAGLVETPPPPQFSGTMFGEIFVAPGNAVLQPDGKIVVAAFLSKVISVSPQNALTETEVVRYNADGTPDTAFGNGGVAIVIAGFPENSFSGLDRLALQPGGKIILAGSGALNGANVSQAGAARLNADGSLDTTFGTKGFVTFASPSGPSMSSATAVAVDPTSGKIVLAGPAVTFVGGRPVTIAEVARLNADGTLDTTFGAGGLDLTTSDQTPAALAIQPDGKVLVGGTGYNLTSHFPELARLNADGTADATFTAAFTYPSGPLSYKNALIVSAIALQPDGKILVGGQQPTGSSSSFAVARFNADGSKDASFGTGGEATFRPGANTGSIPGGLAVASVTVSPPALALGPDGKIVVTGNVSATSTAPATGFPAVSSQQIVARLLPIAVTRVTPGDYTGDGKADIAGYLPGNAVYAYRPSDGKADVLQVFGTPGAGGSIPAPGDYTGDGITDVAVYLPALGAFAIRPSGGGADQIIPFGIAGAGQSIPAPGDYDGSGKTELAVYLPSIGYFAYRPANGGPDVFIPFGIAGAGQTIPAPGDYDGYGKTEIAAYLPSLGEFAIRPSTGGPDEIVPFGVAGAGQTIPVPGDYNGDGYTDLAVYIPSQGVFAYRPSDTYNPVDVVQSFGIAGPGATIPAPGDYTGDGKTDFGAYLPAMGLYAYRPSSGGADVVEPFGVAGVGQTIPASSIPYASQGTVSAKSLSADAGSVRLLVPLTEDLMATPDTAKRKAAGVIG